MGEQELRKKLIDIDYNIKFWDTMFRLPNPNLDKNVIAERIQSEWDKYTYVQEAIKMERLFNQ